MIGLPTGEVDNLAQLLAEGLFGGLKCTALDESIAIAVAGSIPRNGEAPACVRNMLRRWRF